MHTNLYSEDELLYLIDEINGIKPCVLTIVDTLGNMYEKDVVNLFRLIEENLDNDISLGFHSHNSLQLSFSNTKALLGMNIKREIIIDSCIYGMGRGAGNLCTELITKYLNDNYAKDYKIPPLLKIIDEFKRVSGDDAIRMSRTLMHKCGIFAGISSGAAIKAALDIAIENKGKCVLAILPDTAERYLSGPLFEEDGI